MKKIVFSLVMIILGFRQSYAWEYNEYLCGGNSMCYSEDACDQETGYCDDCADNGYGHNEDGVCVKCQDPNCDDDCEDDYTYCEWCKDGWLSYNGKCEKILENCADGCESCSDNIQCYRCKSGYYRADNGTCIKNDVPNCKNISDSGLCSSCETGYLLSDGKCVTLEECITKGYKKISKNYCVPQNCNDVMVNHGTCSKCKSGLALQYNKCVPDTCEEGYHLTGSEYYYGQNNQYFMNRKRCVADNCNYFSDYQISCNSCKEGYYLQDRECVSECKMGYISGTKNGRKTCFPVELGCGYGEKQVGDECVAREDGEGCGVGFYLKDNLCVSESKGCGDGYLGKDGVCISSANGCGAGYKDMGGWCNRIQYTPAEAAKVLRDGNTNEVTITFRK